MRKIFFLVTLLGCFLCASAQVGRPMPEWVTKLPSAQPHHHYYYRVTVGEGATYDKAYAAAFAKALMEAKWKLGVRVNLSDDMEALEQDITANISVQQQSMEIPINKVCDYWEEFYPSSRKQFRLYVLWQIAEDASVYPKFDEFTNCQ